MLTYIFTWGWWLSGKEYAMQETQVLSLGQEDPLEEKRATHSSIIAWIILWTEEPGRLQFRVTNQTRPSEQACMHTFMYFKPNIFPKAIDL